MAHAGTRGAGTADLLLFNPVDSAGFGASIATGDLNQDGEDDLLVGAYGNDASGTVAGAAYMVLSSHLVP